MRTEVRGRQRWTRWFIVSYLWIGMRKFNMGELGKESSALEVDSW